MIIPYYAIKKCRVDSQWLVVMLTCEKVGARLINASAESRQRFRLCEAAEVPTCARSNRLKKALKVMALSSSQLKETPRQLRLHCESKLISTRIIP